MSGEPTTGAKNWADDDDGDDGDLRKEFASTSSPTKPLATGELDFSSPLPPLLGSAAPSSFSYCHPQLSAGTAATSAQVMRLTRAEASAPSLLSRLGGFAIDTTDPPDTSAPPQPSSTAESSSPSKPKIQPSGNLFGKALAGVKADRTHQPAPSNAPTPTDPPVPTPAAPAEKERMRGDLADDGGWFSPFFQTMWLTSGWGGSPRDPPSAQAGKTAKPNGGGESGPARPAFTAT